jgi:hypothetical protein
LRAAYTARKKKRDREATAPAWASTASTLAVLEGGGQNEKLTFEDFGK